MRSIRNTQLKSLNHSILNHPPLQEYLNAAAIVIQENWRDYAANGTLKADLEEEIRAAFAAFDVQGRGTIVARELRGVLSKRGEKMADPEIDKLIETAGGTATVHINQLTNAMLGRVDPTAASS